MFLNAAVVVPAPAFEISTTSCERKKRFLGRFGHTAALKSLINRSRVLIDRSRVLIDRARHFAFACEIDAHTRTIDENMRTIDASRAYDHPSLPKPHRLLLLLFQTIPLYLTNVHLNDPSDSNTSAGGPTCSIARSNSTLPVRFVRCLTSLLLMNPSQIVAL